MVRLILTKGRRTLGKKATDLALRIKYTQWEKQSPGRIAGSASPAKPGDQPDLPAFRTSNLFGLSCKSGLIHSIDSVWTVKRGIRAVGLS